MKSWRGHRPAGLTCKTPRAIIIITRPKPAYGRQGPAGGSLCASVTQLGSGKWWFFVTNKHTLHHNIYIIIPSPSYSSSSSSSSSSSILIIIIIIRGHRPSGVRHVKLLPTRSKLSQTCKHWINQRRTLVKQQHWSQQKHIGSKWVMFNDLHALKAFTRWGGN